MLEIILYFLFSFSATHSLPVNNVIKSTTNNAVCYSSDHLKYFISSSAELNFSLLPTYQLIDTDAKDNKIIATKTKAALLKDEPKYIQHSKPVIYRVYGRKYQTLSTNKNYQAINFASWYGPGFQSHSTSSGERYNMYRLTAAHKTLPLLTYVEVKNLQNGRSVVVKVNDRGPFVRNRLIDLSYAAAKKLGMVGAGIARVSIKSI